ncbi:Polyketide synthase PksJ [Bacillus megaterium]|nr:Polyketide synthase PksJ [Priestia megaterium]
MEERLAIIVESVQELQEKLKGYVEGQYDIEGLYRGQTRGNKETLSVFTVDEGLRVTIERWIVRRKYTKLLDLWVKGLSFDWNKLYDDVKPKRISLPTYPFAKERYWVLGTSIPNSKLVEENFYDKLIDAMLEEKISIEDAVQKIENIAIKG